VLWRNLQVKLAKLEHRLYRKAGGIRSWRTGRLANQRPVWREKRRGLRQANGNWGPENGKGPSSVNYIRARDPENGNYKRTTEWQSKTLL
jgi:hypothetical protein